MKKVGLIAFAILCLALSVCALYWLSAVIYEIQAASIISQDSLVSKAEAQRRLDKIALQLKDKHRLAREPGYRIVSGFGLTSYASIRCLTLEASINAILFSLLTDDELKSVVAHEIAHCELESNVFHTEVDKRAADLTDKFSMMSALQKIAKYDSSLRKRLSYLPYTWFNLESQVDFFVRIAILDSPTP